MPSRHLDPDQTRRYAEYRYDFNRKALAGRVVLLAGGAGGLGAAITALRAQAGPLLLSGNATASTVCSGGVRDSGFCARLALCW